MKADNKITSITLIILTMIIILSACKKSSQSNSGEGNGSGTVQGVITDLNNSPVSNATVTGGSATATTDASGKFTLTNVQFNSDAVVVIVSKNEFFEGVKSFVSANHTVSNAIIKLIPKTVSGTITASSGGNVTIQGGGSVNFGSGFVNASNGTAYTGNVSVSAKYLNPTDLNFSSYMPGDVKAVSVNNQPGTLQSFGVVAVEMNDAAGNKLQMANGKTATITIPIPSALPEITSSLIPLWYFDDTKGAWKQEGVATKQGSNYIGIVSHFTSWNSGYSVDTSQYIRLTINGISHSSTLPDYAFWGYRRKDSGSVSTTDIYADSLGKNPAFQMSFTIMHANVSSGNIPAGNYPCGFLTTMNRVIYTTEYNNNRPQTTVTEYGPVGGYITGSASGSVYQEGLATPLPFTCTYKVLRLE
ncbi:MAG: carboxypeptidase-like regulatory domain-containing protein [Chitinophagaceae bacterium]